MTVESDLRIVSNLIGALFPEFRVPYKNSNKERDLTRGEPGPKVEQTFLKSHCLNRFGRSIYSCRSTYVDRGK